MSRNRIVFDGLDELRDALRRLPEHLSDEAAAIVVNTANEAKTEIQNAYSRGPTGNLIRMMSVTRTVGRLATTAILRNRAPHAYIYEHGTETRQTKLGYQRGKMWGKTPPKPTFIPIAIRSRRRMWQRLKALLQSEGLTVTGDA